MDRFFEFEKAKLFDTWKRSRNNRFSNKKIEEFHNCFKQFYDKIKHEDVTTLSEDKKKCLKNTIDYFQLRVNCLSNNTGTNAPYEVIESIKCAAKDWVADIDDYIILTKFGDYSFFYDEDEEDIRMFLKNDYNIVLKHKTVLLSIPQHYYRDYLNNVVLYHEIGHFVDVVNGISIYSLNNMKNKFSRSEDIPNMQTFFPFLNGLTFNQVIDANGNFLDKSIEKALYHHWMEFFADMFACSYIGKNITKYLEYVYYPDCRSSNYSITHPSNDLRFKLAEDFLSSNRNYILDIIQNELRGKFGKVMNDFTNDLDSSDLYRLLPIEINSDNEIHKLYAIAWDVWYSDRDLFKTANNLSYTLEPTQIYTIINNLIEKSISNYLIQKKWNNVPK